MNKNAEPYILLDSGNCMKLEQAGRYRLIRPALNAFWKPSLPVSEWNKADAEFHRESSGGGIWNWKKQKQPQEWNVLWGGLNLIAKPTNFGHLGFFTEQAANWDWLRKCIAQIPGEKRTLNLFAYTGGATLAMAEAGAEVTHLDAAKGIIDWAAKNGSLNNIPKKIRWICDDALKFTAREGRKNSKYCGIVLDPPSFGRGSQGQVWKIENDIEKLLSDCRAIMDMTKPHFILLSCHSQGFSPISLGRILKSVFPEDAEKTEVREMTTPEQNSGRELPAGICVRMFSK